MSVIVFGASGLLGSAVARKNPGCIKISSKDFNALDYLETKKWFEANKELVENSIAHICCGRVAGIGGQRNRMMFVENMLMAMNLINLLFEYQKEGKTVYYSSSCVYPQHLDHFDESDMFTGVFEPTNEGYALAKASGQKLCYYLNQELGYTKFLTAIPPNLYGDNDNWDIETCHVLPALAQRIIKAKEENETLTIWGVPDTRREFMRSDDVANAVEHVLENDNDLMFFNTGQGGDITIGEVVQGLSQRLDFNGKIEYNGKLVGKTRKLLKTSVLDNLNWKPTYGYNDMLDYIAEQAIKRNNE